MFLYRILYFKEIQGKAGKTDDNAVVSKRLYY